MKWVKVGKTITPEGKTIIYEPEGANGITIESRLEHVPHANGVGTWDHTFYYVLQDGKELAEKSTLRVAKEFAERIILGPS